MYSDATTLAVARGGLSVRTRLLIALSAIAVLVTSSAAVFSAVLAAPSAPTFGTHYKMYSSFEFHEEDSDTSFERSDSATTGGYLFYDGAGDPRFYAAIHPPHGALLTEVEFYVRDSDANFELTLSLLRQDPSVPGFVVIATTATAGTSNEVRKVGLSFTPERIDTATHSYLLRVHFGNCCDDLRLFGARVGWSESCGELIVLPRTDRYVDTRDGRGGKTGVFVNSFPGNVQDFPVTGIAGRDGNVILLGATVVGGHATAVSPTATGIFKILPGGTVPVTLGTSTVNFNAGIDTTGAFTTRLDSVGRLRALFTSPTPTATSHLLIDLEWYCR